MENFLIATFFKLSSVMSSMEGHGTHRLSKEIYLKSSLELILSIEACAYLQGLLYCADQNSKNKLYQLTCSHIAYSE